MALATKEPDNDQKNNPAAWDESTGSRLSAAEQSALSDIENNYGSTADSSDENANIEKARESEERGTTPASSTTKSKVSGARDNSGNTKDKLSLNFLKKKGPLALIGLLLGGGGGLFAALLSPGLALVQLKEAMSEDLNDAVSAMDERAQHIFRAQQKKQTRGLCTRTVTVRCNYRSMSESQIKKLAKQGITVENDGERKKTPSGRYHVTSFKFMDSDGSEKFITADNFRQTYRDNPHFRGLMNRYYSPRWMSIRDAAADGVKKKFKLSFNRSVNGKNKSEMKDQLDTKVREGVHEFQGRRVHVVTQDIDGTPRDVYVDAEDPDAKPLRDPTTNQIINPDETEKQIADLKKQSGGGLRRTMSIGLSGANMFTGGAESYCMISKTIRMASMAARNIKYTQYMRYALVFLNSADASLMGTMTPEAAEFLGDILTKKDMREKVLGEGSVDINNTTLAGDTVSAAPVDNPHKGKDAFDATSVKAAMYGGGGSIDMREATTSFSAGLGATMNRYLKNILGPILAEHEATIERTCAFWQNPLVQGAGLALSVASIVASGGAGAAAGATRAVGTTVAFMIAMSMLQSKISDMITGKSIDSDSFGVDAGNAIFAGSGALFGSMASTRGMRPLSTTDEIRENMQLAHQEQERYTEVARLEAADAPFDVHNKYSFLGSMAWSLAPVARQSSHTVASIALSPLRFVANATNWIAPNAQAATVMSEKRFQQCNDDIYDEENLNMKNSVDMMCNLRFGMSEAQRNADPEKVAQWMIDSCQVNPITGEPNLTGECPDGCNVNENSADTCRRTSSSEEAMAMLNSTRDQIASAMKYDSHDIDRSVAQKSIPAKEASIQDQLPQEISTRIVPYDKDTPRALEVTKDIRSYAHFLRYCRFGDEEGRKVNFGDRDVEVDDNGKPVDQTILTGLPIIGNTEYSSTGKECLTSNNCPPNESNVTARSCRPPQYDLYEVFTLDQSILEGFEMEEGAPTEGGGGSGASTGEFGWPMGGEGTVITSCFAPRGGSFHGALDIAAAPSLNPEIIAADGGEVVMVRNGNGDPGLSGFGEAVVIKHDNGYYTRYSHMRAGSIVVREGDKVDKGQKLGIQGNTGYSFGDHLDFGIGKEMPPYNNNSENPMKLLTVPGDVVNQAGCSAN